MTDQLQPTQLRCEYRANPLGIDVAQPRLSWQLQSDRRGARQTAYQILVASSAEQIADDHGDLWDSGKVSTDQSVHVVYSGQNLQSGQRAWWNVRVWDEDGQVSNASELAWWEMGLLDRGEWQAQWIGAMFAGGTHTTSPAPFVRSRFTIEQPVA